MAKKDEYLLVDGYNIIYSWERLKRIANGSLEDARAKLIEILSDYQGTVQTVLIIVFDAHLVKGNIGTVERHDNLSVVYTKEAETADHYIERSADILAKDYKVRVATSDNLEQIIIMSRGAQRISAQDFLHEVEMVKKKIREKYIESRPIKQNLLLDNLDAKTVEMLEKMRRSMLFL